MNGVAAVRQLLAANAALTAIVPAARIMSGALPLGVTLPAVAVTQISSVDRNIPAPGALRHISDRVQVTVMAATYPAVFQVLAAVRKATADQMPVVTGIGQVTIQTDGTGPDMMDDAAQFWMKTQDFIVGYNAPT